MPKIHVNKSITIDAPIDKVYGTLSDFHTWPAWSPWLICEPECEVNTREDGKYYEWDGKRIGSGNMSMASENAPNGMKCDLTFLKPWKSTSKVGFDLHEDGEGTKVSWSMDSSLPFFMFWMKKMMTAFIGSDYDRGLSMLKEYVETGKVRSKLDWKGVSQYDGCKYIGITRDSSIDNIGPDMGADFEKLWAAIGENKDNVAGDSFSIYHKWDMVNRKVNYTAGIPVEDVPENVGNGISVGNIPASKVYTLRHTGAYNHLGNAWSTLVMMQRNKEFKAKKGFHPFETYVNMPGEVPDEELITDIHFGVK